jgi:alanyl-tRNA synthetase
MHPNEVRASFLKYFERLGHRVVPSSPLVPADDPTLLFTNAGMNQFKDVFLGREKRDYTRAASSQKCMRVSGKHNDLDTVGPSLRHHTFFEMLGNFSFGDYFKEDAIPFAWRLLTEEWKLDPKRLVATVFKGEQGIPRDDEAYNVWRKFLPAGQVGELGMADNFWAMGDTGPCGRCSEIYYDRGSGVPGTGDFLKDIESGSERFVEIWNNVFMEFERQAGGRLENLPARSIDTGMGLERVSAVLSGVPSNYDTDLFIPILTAIGKLAGRPYGRSMDPADVSMRVIADHIRATTVLIADGVVPSNELRGYVLRKIMRRAMRHGKKLGLNDPFLDKLVDVLVKEMGDAYPELKSGRDTIVQVIRSEEERFGTVLSEGLPRLEEVLERAARGSKTVSGEDAFKLYDTYGLPRDFIQDLASAQGLGFDAEGFERAMEGQREKARGKSAFGAAKGDEFTFSDDGARQRLAATADTFEGYTATTVSGAPIVALFDENRRQIQKLARGSSGYAVLGRTPFYLESGGQVSDQGWIEIGGQRSRVTAVVRIGAGLPRAHRIENAAAPLEVRDLVTAEVDVELRDATRRNHTATHLLHAALRQVLGTHVKQSGSLVAPDRLRFDFVHFNAVTPEELTRVERIVNEHIVANTPVQTDVRNTQEAIAGGAMALFGEKYGDRVRVVSVPGFSVELCGGTHVGATGDIGPFFITEESGVAAGVRRIEAVTGLGAHAYAREHIDLVRTIATELTVFPPDVAKSVAAQQASLALWKKEAQRLRTQLALEGLKRAAPSTSGDSLSGVFEINGVKVIAEEMRVEDKESLRAVSDTLKSRFKSGIVFLAAQLPDQTVAVVASVTADVKDRVAAGRLVKELAPIVGGKGGGRPDFAEAGGKDPAKIQEMLNESRKLIERLLAAG